MCILKTLRFCQLFLNKNFKDFLNTFTFSEYTNNKNGYIKTMKTSTGKKQYKNDENVYFNIFFQ